MNKEQIKNIHKSILKYTYSGKLHDAIVTIKQQGVLGEDVSTSPLAMVEETYKLMLKYTIGGMNDPNRDAIFRQLQTSLLMLADSVRNIQMKKYAPSQIFSNVATSMPSALPSSNNISKWFDYLLRSEELPTAASAMLEQCAAQDTTYDIKSLIISAITLSSLIFFDIKKYRILTTFYLTNQEQVWQRALVGLVIISYYFNKRLKLYPESKDLIQKLTESPKFRQRYEATVIQLIRAIDTDKITKKINEEIIPEMTKMSSVTNKIKSLIGNSDEKPSEDKNPEWHEYIMENQQLLDKLTEMSKLQMEGGDVFINTFATLKNYAFFNKIENWFVPFNPQHPAIKELSDQKSEFNYSKFAESLAAAPFICNSDKYSFCMSVSLMPELQRKTLGKYFNSEIVEMNKISKEDNLIHREEFSYKILIQYIQDIYRFFKLNNLGKDFIDIFSKGFSPSGTLLFDTTFSEIINRRKVGEFFFTNEYYKQAFDIFEQISLVETNFEIFQKMGYSAQKNGNIEQALDNFLKAQLFDENQVWNLKKIAWCYRHLNQWDKALEYYQKADSVKPDNIQITTTIGRCLLELEKYSEALKYYYKAEYFDSGNSKVLRAIALCNYQESKYEQALKYIGKIPPQDLLAEDYILSGHCQRKLSKLKDAVENYQQAVVKFNDYTIENLEEAINDFEYSDGEKPESENNLILDYISYEIE